MRRVLYLTIVLLGTGSAVSHLRADQAIQQTERDEAARGRQAAQLCRSLPGYDWFNEEFTFEKETTIGFINSAPESLYVRVRAKHRRLVDAAWWWDPLDKNHQPTLDWYAFRKVYEEAARVISKQIWLAKWKRASAERSIELHVIGTRIGEPRDEVKNFVMPAWRDAGLQGRPNYLALARRGDAGWSTIYFSRDDPNALVTSNLVYPREQKGNFWMTRMEFSFHPRGKHDEQYSKFFVVDPTGRWQMRTYSKALPGGAKKLIPVSYSGGDGSTFERAIIIVADDEKTGVDAEYAYIAKHFPGSRRGSQSLVPHGKKNFDVLEFTTAEKKKRKLYFDISSFFGKWN